MYIYICVYIYIYMYIYICIYIYIHVQKHQYLSCLPPSPQEFDLEINDQSLPFIYYPSYIGDYNNPIKDPYIPCPEFSSRQRQGCCSKVDANGWTPVH